MKTQLTLFFFHSILQAEVQIYCYWCKCFNITEMPNIWGSYISVMSKRFVVNVLLCFNCKSQRTINQLDVNRSGLWRAYLEFVLLLEINPKTNSGLWMTLCTLTSVNCTLLFSGYAAAFYWKPALTQGGPDGGLCLRVKAESSLSVLRRWLSRQTSTKAWGPLAASQTSRATGAKFTMTATQMLLVGGPALPPSEWKSLVSP